MLPLGWPSAVVESGSARQNQTVEYMYCRGKASQKPWRNAGVHEVGAAKGPKASLRYMTFRSRHPSNLDDFRGGHYPEFLALKNGSLGYGWVGLMPSTSLFVFFCVAAVALRSRGLGASRSARRRQGGFGSVLSTSVSPLFVMRLPGVSTERRCRIRTPCAGCGSWGGVRLLLVCGCQEPVRCEQRSLSTPSKGHPLVAC